MVLPIHGAAGRLVVGNTLVAPNSGGPAPAPSFAATYLDALAGWTGAANQATAAFAQGGGPALATVMAENAQADLAAQEFALLVGKALQAYQSVMNMQV
jgi:flagellar hook-basal body complex protein FliE